MPLTGACRYSDALAHQPASPALQTPPVRLLAYVCLVAGNVFVLSSMWALGITGTYLGDYFGILMPARVTGFPFNVLDAPMYVGSTMSFLGVALLRGRWAGVLLTGVVALGYVGACAWEE